MISLDLLLPLLAGAMVSGLISGFAGFGTALFASGIWFSVLPAHLVPPLVVLSAVVGQLVGLTRLKRQLTFQKAWPLISGGIIGVPIGTMILSLVAPDHIKLGIGLFLVIYALWQMMGQRWQIRISPQPASRDRVVGFGGGILGGIAGLSGPLPIVWLQLQNLPSIEQRARYQPFNLVTLSLSAITMAVFGIVTKDVLIYMIYVAPVAVAGAWLGTKLYAIISEQAFRQWILLLLLISGVSILGQSWLV